MNCSRGLYEAVLTYRARHVKYLLSQGIPINLKNERGEGVLHAALHIENATKRKKMFHFLLGAGADFLSEDPLCEMDVLQWACHMGRLEQVNQLLTFAAGELDFRRKELRGRTALHLATLRGDADTVELLCGEMSRVGVSVDIPDKEGLTPYLYAQRMGYHQVASVLEVKGGASRCQFDTRTFRTSQDWSEEGRRERRRQEEERIRASLKMNGRAPKLAELRRSRLNGPRPRYTSRRLAPVPPIQISSPLGTCTHVAASDTDNSSSGTITSISETTDKHHTTETAANTAVTQPVVGRYKRPSNSEMDEILNILSEQLTSSFRKSVPPPPPKIPTSLQLKRVSTLAALMDSLNTKSRKMKLQNAVLSVVRGKGKSANKNSNNALMKAVHLLNKSKLAKLKNGNGTKPDTGSPVTLPPIASNADN